MSELSRIGVAIDAGLLAKFDEHIAARGYDNRSEAFRDMVRETLVQQFAEAPDSEVVGTLTLIYDHHARLLNEKLTDVQHTAYHAVLSTLHVHLDHDNCLEVIILRGKAAQVKKLADQLICLKGVKYGKLVITSPGVGL